MIKLSKGLVDESAVFVLFLKIPLCNILHTSLHYPWSQCQLNETYEMCIKRATAVGSQRFTHWYVDLAEINSQRRF